MRIMQASLVNVSLVTNINKSLKILLGTNPTKSFVQCIHASINGFNDTSMDNSNIAMLRMAPRKRIFTLPNRYCLTSYSISGRHIT